MKVPYDITTLRAVSPETVVTMPTQASDTLRSLDFTAQDVPGNAPVDPDQGEDSPCQGSDKEDEDLEAVAFERLMGLVDIEIGRKHKRPMCAACGRPQSVCWCQNNSASLQHVQSTVLVLQHPHEEKRCLRTAPMLQNALPYCTIHKGKKFSTDTIPELASAESVLLFPGPGAVEVSQLPTVRQRGRPYTLVVLDGTWHQARAIMHKTQELHRLPKVVVRSDVVSQYVIRTQPSDAALSTVESAALALAALEDDPTIYNTLVQPLVTLCHHQLSHGAVVHHSKERRCREVADKHIGKRTAKTLAQCGARSLESSDGSAANDADQMQTDHGDARDRLACGDSPDSGASRDTTGNSDRYKCANTVES